LKYILTWTGSWCLSAISRKINAVTALVAYLLILLSAFIKLGYNPLLTNWDNPEGVT
jgi:hypothetical protein